MGLEFRGENRVGHTHIQYTHIYSEVISMKKLYYDNHGMQFKDDMLRCSFFGIYPVWHSLSLLDL